MITINNEHLKVLIRETGAELLYIQSNGLEYLWQADPKFWGKHSPVLFPIVGELKEGKYLYEGREYTLPRHGFARDRQFSGQSVSQSEAIFMLHSDQETLEKYPFHFEFQVNYKLRNKGLYCTYLVKNIQESDIYFSVGGHPAFKVPLQEGLSYTDYNLYFEKDDSLTRYLLKGGLISEETEIIPLPNKVLDLSPSLFYEDAIVLKELHSSKIKLFTSKDPHGIDFKFEGFPYFGIWAAKDAPFLCLEPWCGIADNIHHDLQLPHKEGIIRLEPGLSWQKTWSVELF